MVLVGLEIPSACLHFFLLEYVPALGMDGCFVDVSASVVFILISVWLSIE
jgi:hypothetical protein